MVTPPVSFYSLSGTLNNGKEFLFESLQGKFVLLVNTASECGYTGQYDNLEKLHQLYKDKLVVLGFPANDFGGQEPGSDADISEFCRINFGVTFTLFTKAPVTGSSIQPVFQWLTDPAKNGWNEQAPAWNFCKYLVDDKGVLVKFFSPGVDPLSEAIVNELQ